MVAGEETTVVVQSEGEPSFGDGTCDVSLS